MLSVRAWRDLPAALFQSAWLATGYISVQQLCETLGVGEDQLRAAQNQTSAAIDSVDALGFAELGVPSCTELLTRTAPGEVQFICRV